MMEKQWSATRLMLTNVTKVLPDDGVVVLLLNGCDDPDAIREEIARLFPQVVFHVSRENLGVAGGRNFLLDTHEAREADYLFILDNDVLIPDRYFHDMTGFLDSHPTCGIAGPLVFRAHPENAVFLRKRDRFLGRSISLYQFIAGAAIS